ncbi:TPA: hypothetical protein ACH91F_004877, partial [Escherichia coli]
MISLLIRVTGAFFWGGLTPPSLFCAVHFASLFQVSFDDIQAMRLFPLRVAAGVEPAEDVLPFALPAIPDQPVFAWLFVSVSPNNSVSACWLPLTY